MSKQIYTLFFLLIGLLQIINSRTITTTNLHDALSQAEPGDTIEIKSGIYRDHPYHLKNGTNKKPIKIKTAPNAGVFFKGNPSQCIFEADFVEFVLIEGPMVLSDALCGFKISNSAGFNITGVSIYNMRQQAISITNGVLFNISQNIIQGCLLESKETAKRKTNGNIKCVEVNSGAFIFMYRNNISFSYGEPIYISNCFGGAIIKNEITNGNFANIYIDSSKDIVIYFNLLRINSTEYNNKYGKACGIALSSENYYSIFQSDKTKIISGINITSNIFIGTRMGIYYFTESNEGTYNEIKILFNTLWNIENAPILFKRPKNDSPDGCEMKNNFIYFDGAGELEPKSAWQIVSNYYYNTPTVPSIYYDQFSKAEQDIPLDTIFNQIKGCENYYDLNLNPECLRPSKTPGKLNLYHSGIPILSIRMETYVDFGLCNRSLFTPSVGAFEYPEGCQDDTEPTDIPQENYDVRLNITYCTFGDLMKIYGTFCNWDSNKAITMIEDEHCKWSTIFKDGTSLNFIYKFIKYNNNNNINELESDPFRIFDGELLAKYAKNNTNGKYGDCDYFTSGNLITLVCSWHYNILN